MSIPMMIVIGLFAGVAFALIAAAVRLAWIMGDHFRAATMEVSEDGQ